MAGAHSVAPVIIDATDQQSVGFRSRGCVVIALRIQLSLHRIEEITIEDSGMLSGEDLALKGDLADVEAIAQKVGEGTSGKWDASDASSGLESSHLSDDPPLSEVGHHAVEAAQLEIAA